MRNIVTANKGMSRFAGSKNMGHNVINKPAL
jgi:hypothetical protein